MVTAGRRYYAPLADLDRQRAHRNFDEHLWLPIVIARHSVGASNWSPTDDRRDLPLAVDGGRDWVSVRPETAGVRRDHETTGCVMPDICSDV